MDTRAFATGVGLALPLLALLLYVTLIVFYLWPRHLRKDAPAGAPGPA